MASQSLQDRISILAGNLQGVAEDMHIYRKIFEDQKTILILNKIAPRLFLRMRLALRNSVFLAMARITDGATTRTKSGERKNISAAGVRDDLKSEGYDVENVSAALANLSATAKHIRDYRSKCIAHLDDEIIRNGISLAEEGGFQLDVYVDQSQIFLDEVNKAIGGSEAYTVKRDVYHNQADAFLIFLMYADDNWEELEGRLNSSNIRNAFREFFSQAPLREDKK